MNLLYPLGTESKWNDNELRYSIRSFEKYSTIDKLIVIGDKCPEWLDPSCFILWKNISGLPPAEDTLQKTRRGLREFKPNEIVWLVDDDFFVVNYDWVERDVHLNTRPTVETVKEICNRTPPASKTYNPRVNTRNIMDFWGLEDMPCYDLHYPFFVMPFIFRDILAAYNHSYLYKTIYANLTCTEPEVVSLSPVARIKDEKDFLIYLENPRNKLILTTGNNIVLNPLVQNWLSENYPKESKYELSRP